MFFCLLLLFICLLLLIPFLNLCLLPLECCLGAFFFQSPLLYCSLFPRAFFLFQHLLLALFFCSVELLECCLSFASPLLLRFLFLFDQLFLPEFLFATFLNLQLLLPEPLPCLFCLCCRHLDFHFFAFLLTAFRKGLLPFTFILCLSYL